MAWAHVMAGAPRGPGAFPPIGQVRVGARRRGAASARAAPSAAASAPSDDDASSEADSEGGSPPASESGEPEAAPSPGAQARERLAWGLAAAEAEGAEQAQKRQVRRALGLIEAGELSKAVNGLDSIGLGDLSQPAIAEQMRKKHPSREPEHAIPSLEALAALGRDESAGDLRVPGMTAFGMRLSVRLRDSMRQLRRLRGTGITGFRNEYLKALSEKFTDERAARVVPLLQEFAERYLNAELPPWFYQAMATVEICAPIKKKADVGEVPDCRPVGMGEVVIRMINSKLMSDSKEAAHDVLWPHNVGSATRDGCAILAHGIRAITEMRPGFAVVKFDVKNAHNTIRRKIALMRMARNEHLRHLVPAFWSQYVGKSRVYFHGANHEVIRAGFESEEAWRQGCPLAQLGFNQAIHEEVLWLDAELAKSGGGARFNHDDGYAFGPPGVVFRLAEEFEAKLEALGLEIAKSKSECYSRELGLDLRGDPGRPRDLVDDGDGVMREKFPLGVAYRDVDGTERIGTHEKVAKTPGLSDRNILGCGIVVAGVPIGDREYVRVQLAGTALATKSKIEKIQLMLRPESIHALHVLNIFCLQPIIIKFAANLHVLDATCLPVGYRGPWRAFPIRRRRIPGRRRRPRASRSRARDARRVRGFRPHRAGATSSSGAGERRRAPFARQERPRGVRGDRR